MIDEILKLESLADQHRPRDLATMRVAVAELAACGLTALDIAEALALTEAAVRQLLGEQVAA